MTLRKRLALVVAALMTALVVAFSAMLLSEVPTRAEAELDGTQPWVLALLPGHLPEAYDTGPDLGPLVRLMAELDGIRHVTVTLYDADGRVLARAPDREAEAVPGWLQRAVRPEPAMRKDVLDAGRVVAWFEVGAATDDELAELWEDYLRSVVLVALLAVVAMSLIVWFTFRALEPLHSLRDGLRLVGAGRRAPRLPSFPTAEMDEIAASFNRMADDLGAAHASREALMRKLIEGEERTRRSIAHDLHDELSPYLVALQPVAHTLQRQCAGREGFEDIAPTVRTLVGHQTHILATLRRILSGLHPPELETLGLRQALERLVGQRRDVGDPRPLARLHTAGDWSSFGPTLDVSLYRMVQECLTNARRHARPERIDVRIETREAEGGAGGRAGSLLCLEVHNDGVSLESPEARDDGGGLGTLGLRDRCMALGGEFESGADGQGGWFVRVRIPLSAPGPSAGAAESSRHPGVRP